MAVVRQIWEHRFVRDVLLFIGITLVIHFSWKLLYPVFSEWPVYSGLSQWLTYRVFTESLWVNQHILGFDITTDGMTMWFSNGGYVGIVSGCSGLKHLVQVFFLLLFIPGPWKHKLWYIPASMLVLHFTNILRVCILSASVLHFPDYWDFLHDWILRPFFYLVIFVLWVIWQERFRNPALQKQTHAIK